MQNLVFFLICVLLSFSAHAVPSACTSNITRELEECERKNFEYSDGVLNSVYSVLASKLSPDDKVTLIRAQGEWLAYMEKTCKDAYESVYPGAEAGIDKWTCKNQITRARIIEIKYLTNGVGSDLFFRALYTVSRIYENGNAEKFIAKLKKISFENDEDGWRKYVEYNCLLAVKKVSDEKDLCIARQIFYKY